MTSNKTECTVIKLDIKLNNIYAEVGRRVWFRHKFPFY